MDFHLTALLKIDPQFEIIQSSYDLKRFSFFTRGQIKKFINSCAKKIAKTLEITKLKLVEDTIDTHTGYFFTRVIEKNIYISLFLLKRELEISFSAVNLLIEEMATTEDFNILMKKYRDINKFDPLNQVDRQLDETLQVVKESLESVINRGAKLDQLSGEADLLEKMSNEMFKKAKNANRCCWFF